MHEQKHPNTPSSIVTGFLGSGKTTLILSLIPQLPRDYKLALLKNEFGDVAVDSQLAASQAVSGVQELLNGCICCNLVGQLGDVLEQLRASVEPDRIVIETSGSAFPATLAMEVNRLGRETGRYVLDGVMSVIDVENWKGYEDTSMTAKVQVSNFPFIRSFIHSFVRSSLKFIYIWQGAEAALIQSCRPSIRTCLYSTSMSWYQSASSKRA